LADRLVVGMPSGPDRARALVQRALLEDDDCATADALLRSALVDADDDEPLRGRVLEELSKAHVHYTGSIRDAIKCVGEALAIGERAGDAYLEVRAATSLAQYEALAGTPRPERLARAIALADEPRLSFGARSLRARHAAWGGDLAVARGLFQDLHADEIRLGYEHSRSRRLYDLALIECLAGNFAEAEKLARGGTEAAVDAEDAYYQRLLLHATALVHTWLGRAAQARLAAESLLAVETRRRARPGIVNARSVLGLLALSLGDAEAAARELAQAVRLLEEMEVGTRGRFGFFRTPSRRWRARALRTPPPVCWRGWSSRQQAWTTHGPAKLLRAAEACSSSRVARRTPRLPCSKGPPGASTAWAIAPRRRARSSRTARRFCAPVAGGGPRRRSRMPVTGSLLSAPVSGRPVPPRSSSAPFRAAPEGSSRGPNDASPPWSPTAGGTATSPGSST
jgi:hypothetical protein